MKELIVSFTKQLSEALLIGENARLTKAQTSLKQVLITGLGGSGIGGSIVAELAANYSPVPILVNKDYFLPHYVGPETLVIVSSYSGNTEETIQAMEIAIERKAKIVCITSGGKILEMAVEKGIDHIVIPGGMPPRSCLGYSFTQLLFVLDFFNFIDPNFKESLKASISLIDKEEPTIITEAKKVAVTLMDKIPVIYTASGNEGVAIRFRQQVNENAKTLCWHHVIPEMNHNELVGWKSKNEKLAVIFFRYETDYIRIQKRIEINKEIISKYTSTIIELLAKGTSPVERALYMIHLGDWISYFLAEQKHVDAVEVSVIDYLKSSLAKI